MPCSDGGYREQEIAETNKKVDKYARLLCFICEYLPKEELEKLFKVLPDEEHGNAGKELKTWWIAHQEFDRARKEGARREKIKAEALRKLTLEERKALGFA